MWLVLFGVWHFLVTREKKAESLGDCFNRYVNLYEDDSSKNDKHLFDYLKSVAPLPTEFAGHGKVTGGRVGITSVGRVYKIAGNGKVYIGSTFQTLKDRLYEHSQEYHEFENGGDHPSTRSYLCFGGKQPTTITQLAQLTGDRHALNKLEETYHDKYPGSVNLESAYVSPDERIQNRHDYSQQYNKHHTELHKSKQCGCGGTFSANSWSVHSKTKRHLAWADK
jgi:hypothetical protein